MDFDINFTSLKSKANKQNQYNTADLLKTSKEIKL